MTVYWWFTWISATLVVQQISQHQISANDFFIKGSQLKSDKFQGLQCSQCIFESFEGYALRVCKAVATTSSCQLIKVDFKDWSLSRRQNLLAFPIDEDIKNNVRIVRNALFCRSNPVPFVEGSTKLIAWSEDVITNYLDLELETTIVDQSFIDFVSGNSVHVSSQPLTHRYGGHQFGVWAGQLGDGRAHLIGEYVSLNTGQRWELQLKGSGKTPFSRDGDGRAVLRSSVREFLASEAMFHLAIPTSRAATLVVSSERVKRDPLYNGQIRSEQTAVVLRVAQSWFRFGSFELLARSMELDLMRQLADFVITQYFTEISNNSANRYADFFEAVVRRSAHTTALWHGVGFVHGVLNTDNISILGLTIDYGPFRFIDTYDPNLVSNGSDDEGRYRLLRQPIVIEENLKHLLSALSMIMSPDERSLAISSLNRFRHIFNIEHTSVFLRKLGLDDVEKETDDEDLVKSLLQMMADTRSDFTATFRQLSEIPIGKIIKIADNKVSTAGAHWAIEQLCVHRDFKQWFARYKDRLSRAKVTDKRRLKVMQSNNPRYVLRNWMAQEAIMKAENGDFTLLKALQRILEKPYIYQLEAEIYGYADRPPSWAANISVTCSS